MLIRCKIERKGGTVTDIGGVRYHFKPYGSRGGPHLADVETPAHIGRFLSIVEAYEVYVPEDQVTEGLPPPPADANAGMVQAHPPAADPPITGDTGADKLALPLTDTGMRNRLNNMSEDELIDMFGPNSSHELKFDRRHAKSTMIELIMEHLPKDEVSPAA